MPNLNDPRRSTKYRLFVSHYEGLKEELSWTVDRLHRLCAALQLTEYEVAALIRLRITDIERYISRNDFPAPIELHLTLLERAIFPSSKPPLFPNAT